MHELSLVQNMLEQVKRLAAEHQAERVNVVTVLMGPFSGVVPDSFLFAFEALKKEDARLTGAVLELERPDPSYLCLVCGEETRLARPKGGEAGPDDPENEELHKKCPFCGSRKLSPLGGTELILRQVRME